jgi:hypothetical protein
MGVHAGMPNMTLLSVASALFDASVLNIADLRVADAIVGPNPFPPAAVKAEFNADAGWTAVLPPRPSFARTSAAMIYGIFSQRHRTLAWIVHLFDARPEGGAPPDVLAAQKEAFYALRFER